MKKIIKPLLMILILVAAVFVYNKFTNYSLFDFTDINAPVYQEESETADYSTDAVPFEKLYYGQLDDEKKKIYDKIYFALIEHKESVRIHSKLGSEEIFDIVGYVLAENAEIFWFDGTCSYDKLGNLTFEYIYTPERTEELQTLIDGATNDIIANASLIEDEYQRALTLFDYVASSVEYDDEAVNDLEKYPDASTIVGAFINKKAVCGGYSKAYQYLLIKCGLNGETVYGTATLPDGSTENHAWNLQYINGNYYYSDVTWGDSFAYDASSHISHIYFAITTEEMTLTHTLDDSISYPLCSSLADNYYVRNGLYFEYYDRSAVTNAIRAQLDASNAFIEIKFKNTQDYQNAVAALITNGEIYYALLEIDPFASRIENDRISYSTSDAERVLTLILNLKTA